MTGVEAADKAVLAMLTLASGCGDAWGFVHAANIWRGESITSAELWKSALGFAMGVVCYWLALHHVGDIGVTSPEAQTLAWFVVTLVGVALMSGAFARWSLVDKGLATIVFVGVALLLYRTASAGA